MMSINARQFVEITGHINRYCDRVNFFQDFPNVVNVVFDIVGPLSLDATMLQSDIAV